MRTSLDHWQPLCQRIGAVGNVVAWRSRLLAAYAEPQRAYHTLQHLHECLQVFDEAKESGLVERPD